MKLKHSDEEAAIYRRIAEGDIVARNEMAWQHAGLVQSVATYYAKRNPLLEMDDLVQEGRIGVIHALSKFDVDRGYRFSTYATHWIKHYVQRYVIANHSNVSAMKKDAGAYTAGNMTEEDVRLYEIRCISSHSINEPTPSGDSFDDVLPDDDEHHLEEIGEHSFEWSRLRRILSNGDLSSEQRVVLCMRYGVMGHEKSSAAQIAKHVGCQQQDVSKIESEAVEIIAFLIVED